MGLKEIKNKEIDLSPGSDISGSGILTLFQIESRLGYLSHWYQISGTQVFRSIRSTTTLSIPTNFTDSEFLLIRWPQIQSQIFRDTIKISSPISCTWATCWIQNDNHENHFQCIPWFRISLCIEIKHQFLEHWNWSLQNHLLHFHQSLYHCSHCHQMDLNQNLQKKLSFALCFSISKVRKPGLSL